MTTDPKELLKNWEKEMKGYQKLHPELRLDFVGYIHNLLMQQDLVSREAQRKEDAEIFKKETEGLCHAACGRPLQLGVIYQKILNRPPNSNA